MDSDIGRGPSSGSVAGREIRATSPNRRRLGPAGRWLALGATAVVVLAAVAATTAAFVGGVVAQRVATGRPSVPLAASSSPAASSEPSTSSSASIEPGWEMVAWFLELGPDERDAAQHRLRRAGLLPTIDRSGVLDQSTQAALLTARSRCVQAQGDVEDDVTDGAVHDACLEHLERRNRSALLREAERIVQTSSAVRLPTPGEAAVALNRAMQERVGRNAGAEEHRDFLSRATSYAREHPVKTRTVTKPLLDEDGFAVRDAAGDVVPADQSITTSGGYVLDQLARDYIQALAEAALSQP